MARFTFQLLATLALSSLTIAVPTQLQSRKMPTLPSEDSFYRVPSDIDQAKPGQILQHRLPPAPIAAFGLDPVNLKATHQIQYRTTDSHGNATATVLTVMIPHNADTSKVLSYQIAEDASSLDCSPSYALQLEAARGPLLGTIVTQAELLLIEGALEQGWVVISADFEGPKGAYLANKLAGYATLDGIRAALNSGSFTGIKSKPTITMWGYSGGSLATNFAAELQPSYAPELAIAGAAVGGTVPNITNVVTTINRGSFAGLIPTGILGLCKEYPELDQVVKQHLKPEYADKVNKVLSQCLAADAAEFLFQDIVSYFDDKSLIYTNPIAVKVLAENALGQSTPKIPLFWYKSINDEVSPIADSDKVVDKYCSEGASIEYERDFFSEHGSLAATAAPKALSWLKKVMNGHVPAAGCSKKSVASTLLDPSTLEILPKFILDALLDLLQKPVGPLFG